MRDLMALNQKLGLPDRRSGREKFEECDLSGNNVFGRGFCESPGRSIQSEPHAPSTESGNVEAMVREIADRVMAGMRGIQ
jgi:hypothetical protein